MRGAHWVHMHAWLGGWGEGMGADEHQQIVPCVLQHYLVEEGIPVSRAIHPLVRCDNAMKCCITESGTVLSLTGKLILYMRIVSSKR